MSNSHSPPSSQTLPSSNEPLLSSPPQIHFSLSPPPRVESRESDWTDDTGHSYSPTHLPHHGPSPEAPRSIDRRNLHSPNHHDLKSPGRAPYLPRNSSFPRMSNPRGPFENIGRGLVFTGGRGGGTNGREEESLESGARRQTDVEAQNNGRRDHGCKVWVLILLGMLFSILCMVAGFLGVWFGVLTKKGCGWRII